MQAGITSTLLTYMMASEYDITSPRNRHGFELKYHLRDTPEKVKNEHSPKKRTKKRSKKKRGY